MPQNLPLIAAFVAASTAALAAPNPLDGVVTQLKPMTVIAKADSEPQAGSLAAFYPSSARAARQEGSAFLRCAIAAEARFDPCTVVAEDPSGAGFGEAAIALARRIRQPVPEPKGADTHERFAIVPISFWLEDTTSKDLAAQIVWEHRPVARDVVHLRRPNAMGYATVSCKLQRDGAVADCHVLNAAPWGYGLNEFAAALAGKFKARSTLKDGSPIPPDARLRIPVQLAAPP